MKKILILALLALSNVYSYAFVVDSIYYKLSYGNAIVTYKNTNYNSYSGIVVIPDSVTYNGMSYCVTGIGENAFRNCSDLTSVAIPNSVTSIGKDAFYYCSRLTSVTMPNNLTSIGREAFYNCTRLTSITIPNTVTIIEEAAFNNCSRLNHIYVASSTPVDCAINSFVCNNTDYVRSKFEIYNYAILHVPMGSKEEYAAAYEWRYFLKIKEDLDINGQTFYTTLSVNQAGDGYVKHYVKADEPYTLYIGSEAGMHINTVMFNGEDVTDQLIDGYYTTPNIISPSKIVVSFEQNTNGIASVPADDNLHVYGSEGSLYISGVEEPQVLSVYTLDGKLTSKQMLESDTKIKLNEGIYIVKVGERTFKVSL